MPNGQQTPSQHRGREANMRPTFPHDGDYLAKDKYLEAGLEAKARMRATWSTPNLES